VCGCGGGPVRGQDTQLSNKKSKRKGKYLFFHEIGWVSYLVIFLQG